MRVLISSAAVLLFVQFFVQDSAAAALPTSDTVSKTVGNGVDGEQLVPRGLGKAWKTFTGQKSSSSTPDPNIPSDADDFITNQVHRDRTLNSPPPYEAHSDRLFFEPHDNPSLFPNIGGGGDRYDASFVQGGMTPPREHVPPFFAPFGQPVQASSSNNHYTGYHDNPFYQHDSPSDSDGAGSSGSGGSSNSVHRQGRGPSVLEEGRRLYHSGRRDHPLEHQYEDIEQGEKLFFDNSKESKSALKKALRAARKYVGEEESLSSVYFPGKKMIGKEAGPSILKKKDGRKSDRRVQWMMEPKP